MISLRDFVRTCYAPTFLFGQRSINTVREYCTSANYYCIAANEPPINQLGQANHARFIIACQHMGLANETIRKHCRNLNSIFSKLGPVGYKNRDALGFLPLAPWIRPPRAEKKLVKLIEDDPVDRLVDACFRCPETLEFPKYLEDGLRPMYWRTKILFVCTTALRHGIVSNLSWDDVDPTFRFFLVPSEFDKGKGDRRKPIHPAVLRGLQAIRTDRKKLFPWSHGNSKWYECWAALNTAAGTNLLFHDLKRYALQLAVRSGADTPTIQALGDHAAFQTTMNHYVQGNLEAYVQNMRIPGGKGVAQ